MLARGVNRIPLIGELLTDVAEAGVKGKEQIMKNQLADILLDPKKTAELLRKPEGRAALIFANKQLGILPGVAGASLSNFGEQ